MQGRGWQRGLGRAGELPHGDQIRGGNGSMLHGDGHDTFHGAPRAPPECLMPRVGTTLADLSPHHLVLCIVRVFEELYQ